MRPIKTGLAVLLVCTCAIRSSFAVEGIVQACRSVSPGVVEYRVATAEDWFVVDLPLDWFILRCADIMKGGELVFEMRK